MAKKHARAISQNVNGATGRLVKGHEHAWNLEAPEKFNEMVRAWLNAQPLPDFLQPLNG